VTIPIEVGWKTWKIRGMGVRGPQIGVCFLGAAVVSLVLVVASANANAKPPSLPTGMTQQEYDDLVKAVGESVVQTLSDKGLVAKPSASQAAAKPIEVDEEALVAERVRKALGEVPRVLAAYPEVGADLAGLPARLDDTAAGGRGFLAYLGLLALTVAAALLAELGIGRLTFARRDGLARQFAATGRLRHAAALALLDGLAFSGLWIVAHVALGTLFADAGAQTQFAASVLGALVTWRTFLLFFRVYLRPDLAAVRIAPIGDESARRLFRLYGLTVLIIVLALAWVGNLVSPGAISATILTNSMALLAFMVFIVLKTRRDVGSWLLGLIDEDERNGGFKAALARHWHWIALPIVIILGLARASDALSNRIEFPIGVILTLDIIIGLLLIETLSSFVVRSRRAAALALNGRPDTGRLLPFLVRAVRATIWVGAAAVLVRTWAVDVLNIVDEQAWGEFSRAWRTTVVTALLAYFAWEAVLVATKTRRAPQRPGAAKDEADPDTDEASLSATRLETLAPFLRIVFGILIALIASLMILSDLGVSITPFIAGASVFGLAISFGSQTLVRDIVSGIFYLADDAFRVGEYIDCGKAKGTVEGFTLRSLRLRHQNGQVHTIPFGQLGQITNFSRDWSTLKFNLRFARDTDIEKLRKVTKKVGLAMAEDPELKDDFLEPLKLQGVADIDDNATIMRFKTTVLPIRPSYIQREAIKRLIAAFDGAGIEFASAAVAFSPFGAPATEGAASAALPPAVPPSAAPPPAAPGTS
jgi:moderate conductance mechanosensitive channel